ncbi:hypothetical protein ACTXLJ_11265 [Psychrobacter celer]|uniref:hypothetical protein n=1 Tax=Psychrobacter celer TaxID=306572 RepID=UPI003FD52E94
MLGVGFNFSGCTSIHELTYGKEKPSISYTFLDDKGKRNGIYAWKPNSSAAVSLTAYIRDKQDNLIPDYNTTNPSYLFEQKACVMSAAAIKARDSEGDITLNLTPPTSSAEVDFGAIIREVEKITLLSAKHEAATFLDVAFFGICMASNNGSINSSQVDKLMSEAIAQAASIANGANVTTTTNAPVSRGIMANPIIPGERVSDVEGLGNNSIAKK